MMQRRSKKGRIEMFFDLSFICYQTDTMAGMPGKNTKIIGNPFFQEWNMI